MMEKSQNTWKLADLGERLKKGLIAFLKGQSLSRVGADRYFLHILYTFLLFGFIIWISLITDSAMNKVVRNNETIRELQIENGQLVYEFEKTSSRANVERMLIRMGSDLKEPVKPATTLNDEK